MPDGTATPTYGRELIALRPCDEHTATRLRLELSAQLAGLAAEVDGGELELRLWCDADGAISTHVYARARSGDDGLEELDAEVALLLDSVAELATSGAPGPSTTWPVVAAHVTVSLDYLVGDDRLPTDWEATSATALRCAQRSVLVDLIAGVPNHGISVTINESDDPRGRLRPVRVSVLTEPGGTPSLRLRSAVKQLWPGLSIARSPGPASVLRVPAGDLAAFFAVPVAGDDPLPGIVRGASAAIPMPLSHAENTNSAVRLGHGHTATGSTPSIALSAHERLRHLHVTGRTGTGKSSLLAAIAHQVASKNEGMLVLDPHGPLVDRILAELPDGAAARTWVIRSGDTEAMVPINPLDGADEDERERALEAALDMFQELFDPRNENVVGPRFRERVGAGIRALQAAYGRQASLLHVPYALADDSFLVQAAAKSGDPRLQRWLHNEKINRKSSDYGDLVSWCNSKFEPFNSNPALRGILGSGHDAFDLASEMDRGRIILVDLSKSHLGEPAARLLGFLHLNRAWAAALRRETDIPFTVMVDEAHTVTAGALTNMLSEGRKFGISVVMAHQFLEQLDPKLLPAVDGNVATSIAFRSSVRDVEPIVRRFGSMVGPSRMMTLPDLSAVIMRTATATVTRPHTLTVDHNETCRTRSGAAAKEHRDAIAAVTDRRLVRLYSKGTAAARSGLTPFHQPKPPADAAESAHAPGSDGFLTEWLAKRTAGRAAADGTPASPSSDSLCLPAPDEGPAGPPASCMSSALLHNAARPRIHRIQGLELPDQAPPFEVDPVGSSHDSEARRPL